VIRLLLVPIGVGVGIGIGIDSDWVVWLVLMHRNDRPSRHTRSMYGHIQFLVSKSLLLSFDSDSDTDTDPDPDYNPCRNRDAFVPQVGGAQGGAHPMIQKDAR